MQNLNKKEIPTILVVDDMSTNLLILSDLLKDEYDVKIAKNGKKALELVHSNQEIDLILLDVMMPDIDGYEVCKELKNNTKTKNIPIIFVTARDNDEDEEYGLNLGAIDYITKPFNKAIVKLRVKNHLELKLKSDLLEELSMYDGLTHIPNRRFFDKNFEMAYKDVTRENHSLALMMIDIDFFKPYNDNYGHGKGDETLKKVAQALTFTLKRPTDLVARYGGEEFVILIKNIERNSLEKIANKLLRVIHELSIVHEYSKSNSIVTISIGISYTKNPKLFTKEELLKIADEELYKAKENGKDQYSLIELES